MHASEFIGKLAIRYLPSESNDKSYREGVPVFIHNVTDTHVYVSTYNYPVRALLLPEWGDGWVAWEPGEDPRMGTPV